MGKTVEAVGLAEISAASKDKGRARAEYAQLPSDVRANLMARVTDFLLAAQDQVDTARGIRDQVTAVVDLARAERQRGIIEGMRMVMAQVPVAAPPPTATVDDAIDGARPWPEYIEQFFADRPGLTQKTRRSYLSAFGEWKQAVKIDGTPLRDIMPRHVTAYADYLRDRANGRDVQQKLHRMTIVRALGHIKAFLSWAIGKHHVAERAFEKVQAREATQQERIEPPRRAFTVPEMQCLFDSPVFVGHAHHRRARPGPVRERDEHFWFFAIAAFTGARTSEIAEAPARLIKVGGVDCIDLRVVGTKSGAGPRLVPVIHDLRKLGFVDWAAAQAEVGRGLIFNPKAPRTSGAWSKWCNRYINITVLEDPLLVLYSLRHSFRQTLRAARLGDELMNKIFGHEAGDVGEGYGRELSPDEAQAVVDNVKSPIALEHLWTGKRKA
jgi:integrase